MVALTRLEISAISESRRPSSHDYDSALPALAQALDTLCARQLRHVALGENFATSVCLDSLVKSGVRLRLHSLRLLAVPNPLTLIMVAQADAGCHLGASSVAAVIGRCDRTVGLRRVTLPSATLQAWARSEEHQAVMQAAVLHGAVVVYDAARRLR